MQDMWELIRPNALKWVKKVYEYRTKETAKSKVSKVRKIR